jgi:hypothetical protein
MPIPTPRKGEDKQTFISRCMGDKAMNREFPDKDQRAGVCYRQWKDNRGESVTEEKRDEQGRLIVAENVPVVFNATISAEEKNE